MSSDKKETGQGPRQHYVPRFWLDNFSIKKNVVRTIDRQGDGRVQSHSGEDAIRESVPFIQEESARQVFQGFGLFSEETENMLRDIERAGASAVRETICGAENRDLSTVDEGQRHALSTLILSLMFRCFPYQLASTELHGEKAVNMGINSWFRRELTCGREDMARAAAEEFCKRLEASTEWPSLIKGLLVARIPDESMAFATGGVPFANICEDKHRGMFYPISPKLAVCLTLVDSDRVFDAPAELVSTINAFIYKIGEKAVVQDDTHAKVVADSQADIMLWRRTTISAHMPGFAALAKSFDDIAGEVPQRFGPFVFKRKSDAEAKGSYCELCG